MQRPGGHVHIWKATCWEGQCELVYQEVTLDDHLHLGVTVYYIPPLLNTTSKTTFMMTMRSHIVSLP